MPPSLSLNTFISELYKYQIARLGQTISQKLAKALASHGTSSAQATVSDLLEYLPMRYEDRSHLTTIRDLEDGKEASLELLTKVVGAYEVRNKRSYGKSRLFIFQVTAEDPGRTGFPVVVWWFVSGSHAYNIIDYYKKRFVQGSHFIAYGKWGWDKRRGTYTLKLQKPADELEMLSGNIDDGLETAESGHEELANLADPKMNTIHTGRLVPIYRKLGDFPSKRIREVIHGILTVLSEEAIDEEFPAELLKRQRLLTRARALREVHFPPENANLKTYEEARSPAHLRLIFEDFFWLAFGLILKRGKRVKELKGRQILIGREIKESIAAVLPFKLTNAQRRVVREIFSDLQSEAAMNRLLQGDVGSGKTIVALIAMLSVLQNGYQVALMAPTEILAEQHSRNIKRLLAKTPFRVELLTGSLRSSEKRRLQIDLAAGEIHACIGTHAIIQESVKFERLGLVVIDEQHRFGVVQRAQLRARGLNPDVLVMTATPIPRSLAMTVYGDLDVSVIDELPPGRTPIETRVYGEDQRLEVKRLITSEVKKGHQAYVVYPLVEESEKMDLKDATRRYEYLRDKVFPKFTVGLVHGKMKQPEKDEVMRRFVAGEVNILVSTTVIEVGVDVPNASVMVVEHAERFGLSQLHQLRGRVGRGADQSHCLLLTSDEKTSIANERLGIMARTNDGFLIAEKDLELRGAGELLGTKQSGIPEFRIGNIVRDQRILEKARKEAEFFVSQRGAVSEKMKDRIQKDPRFGLAAIG